MIQNLGQKFTRTGQSAVADSFESTLHKFVICYDVNVRWLADRKVKRVWVLTPSDLYITLRSSFQWKSIYAHFGQIYLQWYCYVVCIVDLAEIIILSHWSLTNPLSLSVTTIRHRQLTHWLSDVWVGDIFSGRSKESLKSHNRLLSHDINQCVFKINRRDKFALFCEGQAKRFVLEFRPCVNHANTA